jgi:hypothetical protein
MKKHSLALILVVALAACSTPAAKPEPLALDYNASEPISLSVGTINIVNRTVALPMHAPYVTNEFRPVIADVVTKWGNDRLRAVGSSGQATLIIKDASVTSQPLSLARGFDSWFTRQQSHKYTAKIEVDLDARAADGSMSAFATAHAVRSATLPEDPTEDEKTKAYNDMLEQLMHDLNLSMEASIRQHMSAFIAQ